MRRINTLSSTIQRLTPSNSVWLLGARALFAVSATAWALRKQSPELAVAPGFPGLTPHWTSSAKQGGGTSLGPQSNVWFTLHRGILTETETASGPCWHRYNRDGYGEKEDGSAFDGKCGVGRLWPFLASALSQPSIPASAL